MKQGNILCSSSLSGPLHTSCLSWHLCRTCPPNRTLSISPGDLPLPDSSWHFKPTRLKVSQARRTSFLLLFLIHGGNRLWHFITLSGPQTNVGSSLPHKKERKNVSNRLELVTLKGQFVQDRYLTCVCFNAVLLVV